jgi:hypothetical protein
VVIKRLSVGNNKSLHLVVLGVTLFGVIFAAQQQQVQATSDREKLGRERGNEPRQLTISFFEKRVNVGEKMDNVLNSRIMAKN